MVTFLHPSVFKEITFVFYLESGPVSVEPVSEAEDFDDNFEDDNEMLSAKELLSRHTGEMYGDDDEEDYY